MTDFNITNKDFRIISLNVRGINNQKKRIGIFRRLRKENCDIAFLQETYSNKESSVQWNDEWGGHSIFAHGGNHSRGVAILIKNGLDFQIITEKVDYNGRFIICEVEIKEKIFTLVNIYSPNREKEQILFYTDLRNSLRQMNVTSATNILIGGDWNVVQDTSIDKCGGTLAVRVNVMNLLHSLFDEFELKDIWRVRNPKKKRYTWRQKRPSVQCRLDYFVISVSLFDIVINTSILPALLSDHSPITMDVKFIKTIKGNGLWKLNNSLLMDDDYNSLISENIVQWKTDFNYKHAMGNNQVQDPRVNNLI